LVDGFTNIVAAIALLLFLRPKGLQAKKETLKEGLPQKLSAYKDKPYLWFIFLVILFALCFFQMFTTIPKYFRDDLMLSENYIGFIMALNGLIIVGLEMVLVYILERKNKTVFFISLGTLLCAYSLLLPANGKWITLFMILLITFGEITSMPFMNSFWIKRSNEKTGGSTQLYTQ
jgi:predicted MFS family arabinose efflux permease